MRLGLIGPGRIGAFMDRFAEAYRRELQAFTELAAGQISSPCTIADAVEAGWIAEACTLSRVEHRPVRMSEVRSELDRRGVVRGDHLHG